MNSHPLLHLRALVDAFFGNTAQTALWLRTPNPHFGGLSPNALILSGRTHVVISFMNASLDQGGPQWRKREKLAN